jgi:hypothetical protein
VIVDSCWIKEATAARDKPSPPPLGRPPAPGNLVLSVAIRQQYLWLGAGWCGGQAVHHGSGWLPAAGKAVDTYAPTPMPAEAILPVLPLHLAGACDRDSSERYGATTQN